MTTTLSAAPQAAATAAVVLNRGAVPYRLLVVVDVLCIFMTKFISENRATSPVGKRMI